MNIQVQIPGLPVRQHSTTRHTAYLSLYGWVPTKTYSYSGCWHEVVRGFKPCMSWSVTSICTSLLAYVASRFTHAILLDRSSQPLHCPRFPLPPTESVYLLPSVAAHPKPATHHSIDLVRYYHTPNTTQAPQRLCLAFLMSVVHCKRYPIHPRTRSPVVVCCVRSHCHCFKPL